MKVYVVTEYGGSCDEYWDHVMGIFTDKAKAEEVKYTYWTKVQNRRQELIEKIRTYVDLDYNNKQELRAYNKLEHEWYDMQDIAGINIKEYTVDEFLGGYYKG